MGFQRVVEVLTLAIVTAVTVRHLDRQEFGKVSVVLGYGLVLNVINVSASAIFIRDHAKIRPQVRHYLRAFLLFSLAKAMVVMIIAAGIGVALWRQYDDVALVPAMLLSGVTNALTFLVEPLNTYLSVEFKQASQSRVALLGAATNVLCSLGILVIPTSLYVLTKNAMVALVVLLATGVAVKATLPVSSEPPRSSSTQIIKASLVGFSGWSHLIGVATDAIYRADLLILSWLAAPIAQVGTYNIALQLANFSKMAPQVLQFNASLGLGHCGDDRERRWRLTFTFVKYSALLSLATVVGYALLGRLAISVLAGRDVEEVYQYGWYILGGLCIFNAFRPLVAYAMVVDSVRDVFLRSVLPSSVGTILVYWGMGVAWGVKGMAVANLAGGVLMTIITLVYVHLRTSFRWRPTLLTEGERHLLGKVRTRLGLGS
jgi:O-antigen/teichoic acid export membrane protein